jgi:hypothetical protein
VKTKIASHKEQELFPAIDLLALRSSAGRNTQKMWNLYPVVWRNDMRSKLLAGTAALALMAGTVLASAGPASARGWHGHGFWPGAVAAGIVGGAVAAATSPLWAPGYYDYEPGYAYQPYGYDYQPYGYNDYAQTPDDVQAPAVTAGGDVAYCEARFRSYDLASGTYLGFDGQRHSCP